MNNLVYSLKNFFPNIMQCNVCLPFLFKNLQKQVIEHHENGLIDKDEMQTAIAVINETYPNGIPKCGADSLRFTLLSQKIKSKHLNVSNI